MKTTYYRSHIVVDNKTREKIEKREKTENWNQQGTRAQQWTVANAEQKEQVTASRAGGIAKMKKYQESKQG